MTEFGTELPFLITENFADAKFLIGSNRPKAEAQHNAKRRPEGRRKHGNRYFIFFVFEQLPDLPRPSLLMRVIRVQEPRWPELL
jgi:hypothetical protein